MIKRFRITARDKSYSTSVFLSSEALYLLTQNEAIEKAEIVELNLRLSDFIDVELLGYEFVHEKNSSTCLKFVYLAFGKATENNSGHTIKPLLCWIDDSVFPLRETMSGPVKVRQLKNDEGITLPHPVQEKQHK